MKPLHLPIAASVVLLVACAQLSPYRGEEDRAIKSLSADEVAGYLEGRGLGYAKPAELNGYPGPSHVLELAGPLALTPGQRMATEALLREHKQEVRELGQRYVQAERRLDDLFAKRAVDPGTLAAALAESADLQRRIRESHLGAHLRQTALLTPAQVADYAH
jgi:uncharacterized membrane protein